MDLIFPVIYHL